MPASPKKGMALALVAGEDAPLKPESSDVKDLEQGSYSLPSPREGTEGKKSFKVVGHLVMAMRRFQASLNPTYTFGKRASEQAGEQVLTNKRPASPSPRSTERNVASTSARRISRFSRDQPATEKKVYPTRGHKASYLFMPLAPVTPAVGSSK